MKFISALQNYVLNVKQLGECHACQTKHLLIRVDLSTVGTITNLYQRLGSVQQIVSLELAALEVGLIRHRHQHRGTLAWCSMIFPHQTEVSFDRTGGARLATLRDINSASLGPSVGASHADHGHGDEEDDDSDYEADKHPQNYFAGGERSGLSIQDPGRRGPPGGNMVRDLLRRAAECVEKYSNRG